MAMEAAKAALSRPKRKQHFIQKAIKRPGALHHELHVPEGEKIPAAKLARAAKAPGKLGQRARFAQMLERLR